MFLSFKFFVIFYVLIIAILGTQTTHAKHSATVALLWLYRELDFVKEFMFSIAEAIGVSQMSTRFVFKPESCQPYKEEMYTILGRNVNHIRKKCIPY